MSMSVFIKSTYRLANVIALGLAFVTGISATASQSADIYANDVSVTIQGPIKQGDFREFAIVVFQLIKESALKRSPYPSVVALYSPGGNVYEALKIGRLVRRLRWKTIGPSAVKPGYLQCTLVEKNNGVLNSVSRTVRHPHDRCTCASSCALIWSAGEARLGTIGYHRPYFDTVTLENYAKLASADKVGANVVRSYMEEMGVPRSVIAASETRRADELYWPTPSELYQMQYSPTFARYAAKACPPNVATPAELVRMEQQLQNMRRGGQRRRLYKRWKKLESATGNCYADALEILTQHESKKFMLGILAKIKSYQDLDAIVAAMESQLTKVPD